MKRRRATLHVCTLQDLLHALGGFAEVKDAPSTGVLIDLRRSRVVELLKAQWRYAAIVEQVNGEYQTLKPLSLTGVGVIASHNHVGNGLDGGRWADDIRPVVRRVKEPPPLPVSSTSNIPAPTRQQLMAGR